MTKQRVAVLGASNKPDRYAHKAQLLLAKNGHELVLINPGLTDIDGHPTLPNLAAIEGPIDTLTLYVGAAISSKVIDDIVALKPGRIIFNPSTENPEIIPALDEAGIPWQTACTLILLRSGQF
jgi:uncharacterized protein